MAKNPLDEAEALYRRRKWAELIGLLEPLSSVYRDNARFLVLLGSAYLYKEDIGGAYSCFRRAQSLDYRDPQSALGLAAVYIRRGDSDKAVLIYVEMLERKSRDRKARRGLEYLRRNTGDDGITRDTKTLRSLYPAPPPRFGVVLSFMTIVIVAGVVIFLTPVVLRAVREASPSRAGAADFMLSEAETEDPVGSGGGFEYVLTEKEALATFNKAKKLFADYRDEAALVELNRLMLSNATRSIKAKAEALARYVREPSFLSMPDRFEYADVALEPRLYDGVGVLWKGLPANVHTSTGSVAFDLLIGYHEKKKLEGIVGVRTGFDIKLTPDRPVEVLARVKFDEEGSWYLDCVAIHEE